MYLLKRSRQYFSWGSLVTTALLITSSRGIAGQPWQRLFNGQNIDGWYIVLGKNRTNDPNHLVRVENGAIHMYKDAADGSPQPAGYVATEKEYSNYHLRLEYKWGAKRF